MKRFLFAVVLTLTVMTLQARTLIVYYSYTNNVEHIVRELSSRIEADVVKIEPAEKGLDYAADNYAIGSAQIAAIRANPDNADSYPPIDSVNIDFTQYSTVIVGAPLWWGNMAAPLQTFLFQHGQEMADKNIGLIVSSASSGISGVESDARRLIPEGRFLSPSLWIRSSQTSGAGPMIDNWLQAIDYKNLTTGIASLIPDTSAGYTIYTLSGVRLMSGARELPALSAGLYIINGKKTAVSR